MEPKGFVDFSQTYLVRMLLVGVEQLRRSPMLRYQHLGHLQRGQGHRLQLTDVLSRFWPTFDVEMAYLLPKRN